MAFTVTRNPGAFSIGKTVRIGTYASTASDTGGAIVTGLKKVLSFSSSCATATPSTVAVISGGTVTITTTADQTGTWMAVGE
jgi:hypothetical protein